MSLNKLKEEQGEGIKAILILEIIGKPKEHLVETLESLIKKMDSEPGVKVIEKKIQEPVIMKANKDFFTTFAEVEVEVSGIMDLVILMFQYMPAHIEIIYPELIALTNQGWSDILSELTRRLHGYDEVARVLGVEKNILEIKLRDILEKSGEGKDKEKSKKKAK